LLRCRKLSAIRRHRQGNPSNQNGMGATNLARAGKRLGNEQWM